MLYEQLRRIHHPWSIPLPFTHEHLEELREQLTIPVMTAALAVVRSIQAGDAL
jgi:hypothetical protein